jgi:transposase
MDTNTLAAQEPVAMDSRGRRISARRHRSIEEKRAIVAESLEPGASVAEIARRHGVNANLVFGWRRLQQHGLLETHTRRMTGRRLIPVKLLEAPAAPTSGKHIGGLRIEFAGGVQVHVGADTDASVLARVIELLRR